MIKRLLGGITMLAVVAALVAGFTAGPAEASTTWNVAGDYTVDFESLGGHYVHDMTLTQDSSGNVDGSGGYPTSGPPYSFAWDVTSGSVSGNTLSLTIDYTA